jgi:hypothetical protein
MIRAAPFLLSIQTRHRPGPSGRIEQLLAAL